jgi:hypothetical protein
MRFIKCVVNPEILLRRRFEGTSAWERIVLNRVKWIRRRVTNDFVDDTLVGVEVKSEAGIAALA